MYHLDVLEGKGMCKHALIVHVDFKFPYPTNRDLNSRNTFNGHSGGTPLRRLICF
jgi:hypothetical protein